MKLPQLALSLFAAIVLSALLVPALAGSGFAQSRRQPPTSNEKKNKRPGETTGQGEKQEPTPPDLVGRPQDAEKVTVSTQIVNVDTVVYHKKSGQIVTGLKKENFAIFADGQPQVITNFSTPEAPITVAMVVEYSKWSELFGYYGSSGQDPGTYEVIQPTAMFLTHFIKPPDDYVSIVAFDIRPTPLTDSRLEPKTANVSRPVREITKSCRLPSLGPSSFAACEFGERSVGGMMLPPPRSAPACRSFSSSVLMAFAVGLLLKVPTRAQTSFSPPSSCLSHAR